MDYFFPIARYKIANQTLNLETDDIRCLLLKAAYTPNAAHEFVSSVLGGAAEVTASGYARKVLSTKDVQVSGANVFYTSDDVVWASIAAGETGYGAILFRHNAAGNGSSDLIAFIDTNDLPFNGSGIRLPCPAGGWLTF